MQVSQGHLSTIVNQLLIRLSLSHTTKQYHMKVVRDVFIYSPYLST